MLLRLFRWIVLISLCFSAVPAAAQAAAVSNLSTKDVTALQAMVSAMEAAWSSRDAKAYAAQFTPDAEHINAYGMWWRGRDEIAGAMTFVLGTIYPTNPIVADQVSVKGIGPRLAVVQYRWQLASDSDPDGTRYEKPSGRVTQGVAKGREGWRITHFQSTFINP